MSYSQELCMERLGGDPFSSVPFTNFTLIKIRHSPRSAEKPLPIQLGWSHSSKYLAKLQWQPLVIVRLAHNIKALVRTEITLRFVCTAQLGVLKKME